MGRPKGVISMDWRESVALDVANGIMSEDDPKTISDGCTKHGISRMALWNWEKQYPRIHAIMQQARAVIEERLAAKRLVEQTILEERRKLHRLRRYPRLRKAKARAVVLPPQRLGHRKFIEKYALKCERCGHRWMPRLSPVYKCPHPSCNASQFALRGFFSDAEKKEAALDRGKFDHQSRKRGLMAENGDFDS